jgi:hypothetical protein
MTVYSIHPAQNGSGFEISIVSDNGARQTILGFETVAAVDAWIAEDKRLTAARRSIGSAGSKIYGRRKKPDRSAS